jgi:hypothetical protein
LPMIHIIRNPRILVLTFILIIPFSMRGQGAYKLPGQVNDWLESTQKSNSSISRIHNIADLPQMKKLLMLEIGMEISETEKNLPAILVAANMDGSLPLTTEGAIALINEIISDKSHYSERTWYIIPCGNPESADRLFSKPRFENSRNDTPNNDDLDEQVDEDGFNDLNGDGLITKMRFKHPEGTWIQFSAEPRLMRKADPKKGEQGIYKIYDEGLDDDGDGKYNEDGPGGTNVNINFPHLFKFFSADGGLFPGSTPESFGIMKFAYEHPEIAMVFAFGKTNFCYSSPQGGRKGSVDLSQIKVPATYAGLLGADTEKNYSMKEIIEMVQPLVPPGMKVDDSFVSSLLGLGAVVNPLDEDLVFYKKFSDDYKKYLENKGVKAERFDPEKAVDGSFELWAYYHLGVPVFSMDLWSVPKPAEEKKESSGITVDMLEKMSTEDFLALGEEKITAFLKESGAPEEFTAKMVIEGVKNGGMDTKTMEGMMKQMPKKDTDEKGADPKEKALLEFSDSRLDGEGFVDWKKFQHPDLGEVEIGGFVPFTSTTPPYSMVDSLLELQVPWIFEIVKELPDLIIYETKITDKGGGIYQLEVWIENNSYIPFPTAMGKRNKQPAPAIIKLSGDDLNLVSGLKRTPVDEVAGKGRKKLLWLIQADKPVTMQLHLESKSAGNDQKTVKIGG